MKLKRYIASYQNQAGQCWDIIVYARNWAEASQDARKSQHEYGRLYSVRLDRTPTS